jgi:tetratricopeptide (TPR) repeat protein
MKLLFANIILLCLITACSGSENITDRSNDNDQPDQLYDAKEKALDHFINGSVAESNEDFALAIVEYTEALNYDTSSGIFYALAKNYLALDKLASALKYSNLSINYDSTELDYYDLLAEIFIQAREVDSAAAVLERIIELDPGRINTYYQLANIYEDSKPLKAIGIYEDLTKHIGPDWNVLIHIAELYEKLGYKEEAANALQELLTIAPSNLALQKMVIDFYQRVGKYDEAVKMLDDIIELIPDDLDAREKKAQTFILMDDWQSAAVEYGFILEQSDVPLEIKIRIGASYFVKAVVDTAVLPLAKNLFESIDKDTSDWEVKLYLGAIAISQREDSIAIEYFKYVTENARWNGEAWVRLGGLYFDNQKYEEAEKIMNEAIDLFPYDFSVNLILGLSLAQQGKNVEAKDYLKKALEINPADVTALSAYGFALSQLNENEEAVIYLKRALVVDPNNVNLLGQLGLILNNLKNFTESDSVYEKALEFDPSNALINNNYAYSLSERGLQLERALQMVTIAIEADSLNSSYLDTVGWIYYMMGNYKPAKIYIEKAIEVGGENSVMLDHLGDILYKMGDENHALEVWRKALELDSSNDLLKQKVETGSI